MRPGRAVKISVVYAIYKITAERACGNTCYIGSTRKVLSDNIDIAVVNAIRIYAMLIPCGVTDNTADTRCTIARGEISVVDAIGESAVFMFIWRAESLITSADDSADICTL